MMLSDVWEYRHPYSLVTPAATNSRQVASQGGVRVVSAWTAPVSAILGWMLASCIIIGRILLNDFVNVNLIVDGGNDAPFDEPGRCCSLVLRRMPC